MRAHRSVGVAVLLPALLAAAVPGPVADQRPGTSVSAPATGVTGAVDALGADVGEVGGGAVLVARQGTTSLLRPAPRSETALRRNRVLPSDRTPRSEQGRRVVAPAAAPAPAAEPAPTAVPNAVPGSEPTSVPAPSPEPAPSTAPASTAPAPTGPAPAAAAPEPTTAATAPEPITAPTAPAPAPVGSDTTVRRTVPLGVTVPWGPLDRDRLAATTATVGTAPRYLQWYTGFGEAVDVAKLQAVVDAGAVPVVTWEPWVWTDGVSQPRFAMSTVVAGHHDAYLTTWADALAAWDGPVMLRFAHEMNGSWYPWAAGVNGGTAADHVASWRHVHDLFAARGADRVQWVWAPNVVYPGSTPLASLYPGDAYVDVVGVDGYNWGTSVAWESWKSPAQVLDPTVAELRGIAPSKPLLVTETASSELGGDKAAWVADLFGWAAAQPDLLGVIWFDEDKETDWRIASSAASAAAFRAAFREAVTP